MSHSFTLEIWCIPFADLLCVLTSRIFCFGFTFLIYLGDMRMKIFCWWIVWCPMNHVLALSDHLPYLVFFIDFSILWFISFFCWNVLHWCIWGDTSLWVICVWGISMMSHSFHLGDLMHPVLPKFFPCIVNLFLPIFCFKGDEMIWWMRFISLLVWMADMMAQILNRIWSYSFP